MTAIELTDISKRFEGTDAVRGINVEIPQGQFFSILGPSGCGKTTLLRMIAGFERPTTGTIRIHDRDVTGLPPQDRGVGMVFQHYALFPHMTVGGNVGFGLRSLKRPADEVRRRVESTLAMVDLVQRVNDPVTELSGGEQQRVAVARALVLEPSVLLFDEPLSNLDISLRARMREELLDIHRRTRLTTVYVTHDQTEAMSLSTRVAVMRDGAFEQVAPPVEIYGQPQSAFVAAFLGGSNVLHGHVSPAIDRIVIGSTELMIDAAIPSAVSGKATLVIKPEAVQVFAEGSPRHYDAKVVEKQFLGFMTGLVLQVQDVTLRVATLSTPFVNSLLDGSSVGFAVDWSKARLFPGWES